MRQVDDDTKEILESFIAEGYERLDDAESTLASLGGECNAERLGIVFRLFHSLKGSAGFLDLGKVKELTHEAESLLDFHIKGCKAVAPESLDVIFQTIDLLRVLVRRVEAEYDDGGHDDEVASQIGVIRAHLEELRHAGEEPGPALEPNELVLSELVTRDMVERFLAESLDLIDRLESEALGILSSPDPIEDVHAMFRVAHTVKGNAGFFGYALLESLCMRAESHLDTVRKGSAPLNEAFVNATLCHVDALRAAARSVAILDESACPEPSGERVPDPPSPAIDASSATGAPTATGVAQAAGGYKPLGEILVDMGAADESAVRKALETQEKPLGQLLVDSGAARREDVDKALERQRSMEAKAPEGASAEEVQRREIRVDTAKLDKLFDLVGELITAEAMVGNSPDLAGIRRDRFDKSYNALVKISREIQETTMAIRMIPMEGLFHKMTRLVRDLSRKFGKPVDFRVSGQETEMDKNVIEQISDPLIHILRNSVDHGLETPAERKAAGKPDAGTVSLDARYEGSEIWISVKDDGHGLNRARILEKAVERGLVRGDPASLRDEEVWAFIFEPGFSTAQVVSEVSGRGVGMDVVKKNLERIRGSVDVRSMAGAGTEFVLKIPLTMAIIDGITVRVGPDSYSIPLGDILEFFKAKPGQVTRTADGSEMVNLRGEILPLVKVWRVFGVASAAESAEEGILLVVQAGGRKASLLIDEVIGNQQIVIKSLSEYLGKVEGLSGCSILGDGSVSFIVDTGRLLSSVLES